MSTVEIVIQPIVAQRLNAYKSHYQQWATEQYNKGDNINSIIDAVEYYSRTIKDNRFQKLLAAYTTTPRNILTLSLENIKAAQHSFETTYNAPTKREVAKQVTQTLVDELGLRIEKFEKQNEDDTATAQALAAAAKMTKWCVVNSDTGDYYLNQGPLYLITCKGKKYLCHLPSRQLMNVKDKAFKVDVKTAEKIAKYIPGFGIFCKDKYSKIYTDAIPKVPYLAYDHARNVIKGRWPKAEPYIMQNPEYAYHYARFIIKGRWPEAEPIIMQNLEYAYHYARLIIKGRWPEAEPIIMQNLEYAYLYARGRWPEAEPIIMQNLEYAYLYARDVIKGPWR